MMRELFGEDDLPKMLNIKAREIFS
ncbi:hypothetical protein RB2150_14811 [Rhodobacteraceae bacterium HTCC2150]|nr:hypothetical protein RB2150_14811 [Rhodobacteraceae bacterium HTCC2150]